LHNGERPVRRTWAIPAVERDDHVRLRIDRRCQNVPVVRVRQKKVGDSVFITFNNAVGHRADHHRLGVFDLGGRDVGPVGKKVARPFVIDARGPARSKQPGHGDLHKEITQRRGIEHVRIDERDRRPHTS
jgi:hypothetical protein